MTPETIKALIADRDAFRKLATDYKARNDALLAEKAELSEKAAAAGGAPSAEAIAKVADHLVATAVIDAAQKEAAVSVLSDHAKTLDTVANLANLVREQAAGGTADGNPGQPIKQAGAQQPEPRGVYDWSEDPEYHAMTENVIKLAAQSAQL